MKVKLFTKRNGELKEVYDKVSAGRNKTFVIKLEGSCVVEHVVKVILNNDVIKETVIEAGAEEYEFTVQDLKKGTLTLSVLSSALEETRSLCNYSVKGTAIATRIVVTALLVSLVTSGAAICYAPVIESHGFTLPSVVHIMHRYVEPYLPKILTSTTPAAVTPEVTPSVFGGNNAPVDGAGEVSAIKTVDKDKIKEQLKAAQKECSISAANYIKFATKDSAGVIKLSNDNDFYVQVSIIPCDDNGGMDGFTIDDAYFTSIVLKPGETMNTVRLTKNLDRLKQGQQNCILFYDCYEKDNAGAYQKIGACGLKIVIDIDAT